MSSIKEVAQRAGVSAATVSRALNGSSYVNPDLVLRIQRAVAELDYTPNRLASNLRKQSSMTIGLLISDVKNPFFATVAREIEGLVTARGYSLVLCNSDDDLGKEQRYLDVLLSEKVAGLIVTPADQAGTSLDDAVEAGVPVVCVDRRTDRAEVDTVLIDNAGGLRAAVDVLVEAGAERIAIVVGREQTTTGLERLAGYREGLAKHGIPFDERLVAHSHIPGGDTPGLRDEARLRLGDVLSASAPDAVIVTNGPLIPGSLAAITAAGRVIGDDIAVVAFDELPLSDYARLTTIEQPTDDIARQAVHMLFERLDGETGPAREVVFRPKIVLRASSRLAAPR